MFIFLLLTLGSALEEGLHVVELGKGTHNICAGEWSVSSFESLNTSLGSGKKEFDAYKISCVFSLGEGKGDFSLEMREKGLLIFEVGERRFLDLFLHSFRLLEIWLQDGFEWWYLIFTFLTSQMVVVVQILGFDFKQTLEGSVCKSILAFSFVQTLWRTIQSGCADPSDAVLFQIIFPFVIFLLVDPLSELKSPILFRILWIFYASFFLWQSFQIHLLFYLVWPLFGLWTSGETRWEGLGGVRERAFGENFHSQRSV